MPKENYDINEIVNGLKKQLDYEYSEDVKYSKSVCPEDELEDDLRFLAGEYKDNLEKFQRFIVAIREQGENPYFFGILDKIGDLAPNPKASVTMKITFGTVVQMFKAAKESLNMEENSSDNILGEEEFLMLSQGLRKLDSEDIKFYGLILTEPELAKTITAKTSNLAEQDKMVKAVMDGPMDEYPGDFVSCDDFSSLVEVCKTLVENYEIETSKIV